MRNHSKPAAAATFKDSDEVIVGSYLMWRSSSSIARKPGRMLSPASFRSFQGDKYFGFIAGEPRFMNQEFLDLKVLRVVQRIAVQGPDLSFDVTASFQMRSASSRVK